MTLLEANDYDTAIDIIERVYEVTDDQMVAQQLARFHAEIGNWDHAYQVIEKAMTAIHDNAYLNHTCGQIYKMQFKSVCREKGNIFTDDECLQALQIAQSARFYFKETQRISQFENSTPRNPAGFDGEIRISIDILKSFFINDIVAICCKKGHVIPATRQSLQDCPCKFITSIKENTLQAIESLQAESNLMCMNRINLHGDYYLSLMEGNKIKHYRSDFNKYSKESLRGDIKDEALVNSFIEATQATDEQLQQVIVKHEKTTNKMAKQDLRSFIGTVIELILRHKEINVDTCNILKLCRQFYEARNDCNNSTVCKLEAHFDLLVLHWPLECKAKFREELCPHSVVKNALESWKQLTDERLNKQDKLFCFLSNDIRFPCLIKAENATKSNLHVLNGMICSNGQEVEIRLHTFRTDNIPPIRISTLYPIRMASLYNKRADIVIGFGLNGPKAELLESVIGTPLSMSPRDVRHKTTKVQSKPHASRALQMHQRTAETGARPKSNASLHQFKGQSVHRENTPRTGQQIQHQVLSPPQGFQGLIPRGVLPLQPRGLTFNTDMFPPLPRSNEQYYLFFKNQKPPNQ